MKNKEKKVYGELENVLLTDEEYGKLKQKFPDDFEDRINAVSFYKDAKGKEYKSDYAAILMWDNRDKKRKKETATPKGTNFSNFKESDNGYSDIENRALNKLMSRRRA